MYGEIVVTNAGIQIQVIINDFNYLNTSTIQLTAFSLFKYGKKDPGNFKCLLNDWLHIINITTFPELR